MLTYKITSKHLNSNTELKGEDHHLCTCWRLIWWATAIAFQSWQECSLTVSSWHFANTTQSLPWLHAFYQKYQRYSKCHSITLHIPKLVLVSVVVWQWSVAKPAWYLRGLVISQWRSTGPSKKGWGTTDPWGKSKEELWNNTIPSSSTKYGNSYYSTKLAYEDLVLGGIFVQSHLKR